MSDAQEKVNVEINAKPRRNAYEEPVPTSPAYGDAPIPDDAAAHVMHPAAVVVPAHIEGVDDEDLIKSLIEDGEGIMVELAGGAMHDRLQALTSHFRHVLTEARGRFLGVLILAIALTLAMTSTSIHANAQSVFPAQNNANAAAVGPGGATTNPSSNDIAVSAGPVYCGGAVSMIHNTKFTLTSPPAIPAVASQSGQSQLFFIYYRCSSDALQISTNPPAFAVDVPLSTVLQTNAAGSLSYTITDIRPLIMFPNSSDFIIPFGPGDCAWNATGTLGATTALNLQAIGASFAPVNDISTTAAGATVDNLTCNIHIPQRTTAGKGVALLNDCTIYYGVQTTALTSVGAPTLNTITMPTSGTSETPSTVTPVSLGAVTVTPVIGSANLGLTTSGAFFTEKVALNTPVPLNTDLQMIQYNQTFNQAAAAAQIVNTPGGVCHATMVLW